MLAGNHWDIGHTETEARTGDYLEEEYEEQISELLGSQDAVLEDIGEKPHLLGRLEERNNSFVPIFKKANQVNRTKSKHSLEQGQGLEYTAIIFRDNYSNPKHCTSDGLLKKRRPIPQAFASEFLDVIEWDESVKRWILREPLNGWPGLVNLEVVSMQYTYKNKLGVVSKTYWSASENGSDHPFFPEAGYLFFQNTPDSVQVTLRAPAWSDVGYSEDNPGFVFWFSTFKEGGPRLAHGENIIGAIRDSQTTKRQAQAVRASFFAHRYALGKRKETAKDRMSYHTGVLVEWDHGKYSTIIELAWLNGLGGYGGKSNWIEDRNEPMPSLFQSLPECMVVPWKTGRSELRMIDIACRNPNEFEQFLHKYEGERFVDPQIVATKEVRLTLREHEHIAKYLINYSVRDTSYSEVFRNCQTFGADFYSFLTAQNNFTVHNKLGQITYIERRHMFLYDADKFVRNKTSLASWAGMKQWLKSRNAGKDGEKENQGFLSRAMGKLASAFSSTDDSGTLPEYYLLDEEDEEPTLLSP